MSGDLAFVLILAATVVTGLLAGIGLDKALVQLPARQRMGVRRAVELSRRDRTGSDAGRGGRCPRRRGPPRA